MSGTLRPSPMLEASELIRVNVDAMQLDDLEDHAKHVLDTIAALNGYINAPGRKSPDELSNAIRQSKKLRMHMAHVRDLINARKAALALMQAAQAAGSASTVQDGRPFCP